MQTKEEPVNNRSNQRTENNKIKSDNAKSDSLNWWKSALILFMTLVVCVSAAYYISDKYLWSKYDTSHYEQELASAKSKVESSPNDSSTRVNLGYAYFLNEKYDEAVKQYKIASSLDKSNFNAYINLAIVYNKQGKNNNALKMAQKATELSPKDYKGHLLLGMSYRNLKMYKDAMESLNQANHLMAGNTDILFEIGRVAEDQGDIKNAEVIYKDALTYDPLYKPAIEGLKRVAKK